MAKLENRKENRVSQIFDDLEKYLDFCRDFGYKFDESELYSQRSFAYRQFCKFVSGKPAKDNWAVDAKQA